MTCPFCESSHISHPRYGGIPGGRRPVLVRICLDCHEILPLRRAA